MCVDIKLWNQIWQTCIPFFILPSLDTQVFLHRLFYVGTSCTLHQSLAQKVLLTAAQTAVLDQSFSVKARKHSMPVRWLFLWAANSQCSAMVSLNSVVSLKFVWSGLVLCLVEGRFYGTRGRKQQRSWCWHWVLYTNHLTFSPSQWAGTTGCLGSR